MPFPSDKESGAGVITLVAAAVGEVAMTSLVEDLRGTTIGHWHAAVHGDDAGAALTDDGYRNVCKGTRATRTRYYKAFLSCLSAKESGAVPQGGDREHINLRGAVIAIVGGQSSSTLYSLFGPNAKTSLLAHCGQWQLNTRDHRGVLARLAAEVKVCSHWPYRSGWLAALREGRFDDVRFCTETLVRVLAEWAADNVLLARAYGGEPPLSAVEDLAIMTGRESAPAPVRAVLTRTVELALSPRGYPPLAVLDAVRDELAEMGQRHQPAFDELEDQLAESLATLRYMLPRLTDGQRVCLRDEFAAQFADVARLLGGEYGG
jgi:hypothetical protein